MQPNVDSIMRRLIGRYGIGWRRPFRRLLPLRGRISDVRARIAGPSSSRSAKRSPRRFGGSPPSPAGVGRQDPMQQPSQIVGQSQLLDHLKNHTVDQGTENHRHEKKQPQDLNRSEIALMDENHAGSAVVCPAVEKIEEDPGGKRKRIKQRRGCVYGGLADVANGLDHNANRRRSRGMHADSLPRSSPVPHSDRRIR